MGFRESDIKFKILIKDMKFLDNGWFGYWFSWG